MPERNNYFYITCLDGSVFPVAWGRPFRVNRETKDLSKEKKNMLGPHLGSQGIGRKSDGKCRGFLLLLFLSWTFKAEAAFNVLVCRTGNLIFRCDNTLFDINPDGWIVNDTFIFKALHHHGWINYSFFWGVCVKKSSKPSSFPPWNWSSSSFQMLLSCPQGRQ